jgi:Glyoxalase-like domain
MDGAQVKQMDWSRSDEDEGDDSSTFEGSFADGNDDDDAAHADVVGTGDKRKDSSKKKKKSKKDKEKEKKKDKKKSASKKSKDKDDAEKDKKKKDKKKKSEGKLASPDEENDGEILQVDKDKKKKEKKKKKSEGKEGEESAQEKKNKKQDKPEKKKKKKKDKKEEKKEKSKGKSKKTKSLSIEDSPVEDDPADEDDSDREEDPTENEDPEAAKMKQLLASWDDDDSSSDSSDSSGDDEDEDGGEEKPAEVKKMTKEELGLNDNEIDHIILAAPDYAEALKEFETMTGIKPAQCGTLRGLGIKAARVAMDNNCYIEILAPDPKSSGPIGSRLAELEEGSLVPYHFAVRASELDELQEEFVPNELGYVPDRINLFGATPDGAPAKWGMLFMHGHFLGGVVPFYVDWGVCGHPLSAIPQVGALKGLVVTAPGGSQVHDLLKKVDFVTTQEGEPALEFAVGSPEGTITFSSDKPQGLVFPGTSSRLIAIVGGRLAFHSLLFSIIFHHQVLEAMLALLLQLNLICYLCRKFTRHILNRLL